MAILNYTTYFNALRECTRIFFWLEYLQSVSSTSFRSLPYIQTLLQAQFPTLDISNVRTLANNIDSFKAYLQLLLTDLFATIGEELHVVTPTDPVTVLEALEKAMIVDSETIRTNTIEINPADATVGIVVPKGTNTGSGVLIAGTPTELALEDWIRCVCTSVATSGNETFALSGAQARNSPTAFGLAGAGTGPSLVTAMDSLLTDGSFEDWNDATPNALSEWTKDAGTFATDMAHDTTAPLRGTHVLKSLFGVTNWRLSQAVTLDAGTKYAVGIWLKKVATAAGDLYLEIWDATSQASGGVTEELTVDFDSELTTDWTFHYFTFTAPVITTDLRLVIRTVSQTTAAIYLDAVQLTEMISFNGIDFALFAGATDFVLDDEFGYGTGTALGIDVRNTVVDNTPAEVDDGTATTLIFSGEDLTTAFPVGAYVQHPVDLTWHRITNSVFSTNTTITVTPGAFATWIGEAVVAVKKGRIQELLGRLFNTLLPSSDTPSQEDPIP